MNERNGKVEGMSFKSATELSAKIASLGAVAPTVSAFSPAQNNRSSFQKPELAQKIGDHGFDSSPASLVTRERGIDRLKLMVKGLYQEQPTIDKKRFSADDSGKYKQTVIPSQRTNPRRPSDSAA